MKAEPGGFYEPQEMAVWYLTFSQMLTTKNSFLDGYFITTFSKWEVSMLGL